MRKFLFLVTIAPLLMLATVFNQPASAETRKEKKIWTIHFKNIKGENVPAWCEVAETETEKRRGLMFREKLETDECMIFVYREPIMLSFWMKNTLLPLSIAFIDSGNRIIDIFDLKPRDESIVTSTLPGIYAIEVNRGWFRNHFIFHGNSIMIEQRDSRKP